MLHIFILGATALTQIKLIHLFCLSLLFLRIGCKDIDDLLNGTGERGVK